MHTRWMALAACAALTGAPLLAQATADQARLSLGLAAGATVSTDLWHIANQPITDGPLLTDIVNLDRKVKTSLAVIFHGTYFPGDHFGVTGEAMLIGLGFDDDCEITVPSGSTRNAAVCNEIKSNDVSASAVALSVGGMYRIMSRKSLSPYLRGHLGLVLTQHTGVQLNGHFPDPSGEQVTVNLYQDSKSRRVSPVLGIGVGFTAGLGHGYQLRWELRDNITGIETVTGPTSGSPQEEPPHENRFKHVLSVTFGFDVVLEKRRGRRY